MPGSGFQTWTWTVDGIQVDQMKITISHVVASGRIELSHEELTLLADQAEYHYDDTCKAQYQMFVNYREIDGSIPVDTRALDLWMKILEYPHESIPHRFGASRKPRFALRAKLHRCFEFLCGLNDEASKEFGSRELELS